MREINLKKVLISVIITLVINYSFIALFAYSKESYYDEALQNVDIDQLIFQENEFVKIDDYSLLNWGYGDERVPVDEVLIELRKSKYEKISKTEQVIVRLLQNRWNSHIYFSLSPIDYQIFDTEWLKQAENASTRVEIVEILGEYYFICDYLVENSVSEEKKMGIDKTATYKALSPHEIEGIKNFKGDNEYYGSYSFYPVDLSPLAIAPFDKVLNFVFVVFQVALIYVLISKIRKKSNQGTERNH